MSFFKYSRLVFEAPKETPPVTPTPGPQATPQVAPPAAPPAAPPPAAEKPPEAKGSLDKLMGGLHLSTDVSKLSEAEKTTYLNATREFLQGAAPKPLTNGNSTEFFDSLKAKLQTSLDAKKPIALDTPEKKNAAIDVSLDFVAHAVMDAIVKGAYVEMFADGVAQDIQSQITFNGTVASIAFDAANQAKYDAAKKTVSDKTSTEAAQQAAAKTAEEFTAKHPAAATFMKQFLFGNDDAKFKEAMAGGGTWGFLLGALGIGGGAGLYGSFGKDSQFGKLLESAKDLVGKLTGGFLDFRIVKADQKAMDEVFKVGQEYGVQRTERFELTSDVKLSSDMKVGELILPKDCELKVREGTIVKSVRFEKEKVNENLVLASGETLPSGTAFKKIEIEAPVAAVAGTPGAVPATPGAAPSTAPQEKKEG